jgi:hypothetical protein
LTETNIHFSQVADYVASLEITQTYQNNEDQPLEAMYVIINFSLLTLPPVSSFLLQRTSELLPLTA